MGLQEKEMKEFLANIANVIKDMDYIKSEDVPNIDLYMDQVTTFMDEQLKSCKRYEDDKILTKTMINNYAKNNLLPSPDKKKYSKDHMLTLLFIYYFKNILSISDIQSILNPITDKYFNGETFNMENVYDEIFKVEDLEASKFFKDIAKKYKQALNTFTDFPEEDQKMLHTYSFICMLSFDVYVKKMVIERLVDHMNENQKAKQSDSEENKQAGEDKPAEEAS
ncbi:MAG: DUF1836 domain-containing protein [Lachnospiraceae bacterium]|nr:DUF1836 domain-containing protein [Lachnospiraceae bacterium]